VATQDDLRGIALALPGVVESTTDSGQTAFSIPVRGKHRGLCWTWLERVHPRKGRVPNPECWAIRVASVAMKERIHAEHPADWFVTDPHYEGYPAVVVRLASVDDAVLRGWIEDAWVVVG